VRKRHAGKDRASSSTEPQGDRHAGVQLAKHFG
jgi:hypothetical protein